MTGFAGGIGFFFYTRKGQFLYKRSYDMICYDMLAGDMYGPINDVHDLVSVAVA